MPPPPTTPSTVRIGGVPEHFNLPFALAAEAGLPAARGSPEVEWVSVPGGSGAMVCRGGEAMETWGKGARGGEGTLLSAWPLSKLCWLLGLRCHFWPEPPPMAAIEQSACCFFLLSFLLGASLMLKLSLHDPTLAPILVLFCPSSSHLSSLPPPPVVFCCR